MLFRSHLEGQGPVGGDDLEEEGQLGAEAAHDVKLSNITQAAFSQQHS